MGYFRGQCVLCSYTMYSVFTPYIVTLRFLLSLVVSDFCFFDRHSYLQSDRFNTMGQKISEITKKVCWLWNFLWRTDTIDKRSMRHIAGIQRSL